MFKKTGCLIILFSIIFSLISCSGKKELELSSDQKEFYTSIVMSGLYEKVIGKYGVTPRYAIDDMKAYEIKHSEDMNNPYDRIEFVAGGTYFVDDEDGVTYSGTFKVKGFTEGHGSGWDSCDITAPKNGMTVLPEKETEQTTETTVEDTAETTIYQPLSDYVNENVGKMTKITEVFESDINKDGNLDLCANVELGSGILNSLIVVYDQLNDKGYVLNERMVFDYKILGSSKDDIAVERRTYPDNEKTYGTLSLSGDKLVFVENEKYGAATPVNK